MNLAPPPSRLSNPFATCWTRPDVLPRYEFSGQGVAGQGTDELFLRLEQSAWRGQIIGPHGAGKSSLMREVARRLSDWGRKPLWVTIDAGNVRQAIPTLRQSADDRTVVFLEGFERASRWQQWRLLAACEGTGSGWLLTTHERLFIRKMPVIAQLKPTVELALKLYEYLTEQHSTLVTRNDVMRSFEEQRGNLRDVWFELYEQHEARTHERTTAVLATYR